MAPGRHIKLDLVELIKVINNVNTEMGLQEGTSSIVPITVGTGMRERSVWRAAEPVDTIL